MEITINLDKETAIGRLSLRDPFFIADNNKSLSVKFDGVEDQVLLVNLKNGVQTAKLLVTDGQLSVDETLIREGKLLITVSIYNGTEKMNKWVCEPIVIIDDEGGFSACSEIADIQNQLRLKDEEIAELKAEINLLKDTVSELQSNVVRLWELAES